MGLISIAEIIKNTFGTYMLAPVCDLEVENLVALGRCYLDTWWFSCMLYAN
jgi:hypothetical protein